MTAAAAHPAAAAVTAASTAAAAAHTYPSARALSFCWHPLPAPIEPPTVREEGMQQNGSLAGGDPHPDHSPPNRNRLAPGRRRLKSAATAVSETENDADALSLSPSICFKKSLLQGAAERQSRRRLGSEDAPTRPRRAGAQLPFPALHPPKCDEDCGKTTTANPPRERKGQRG